LANGILEKIQRSLNLQKKIDTDFNPVFNKKELSIYKECINKVYGESNCALNENKKINWYYDKSKEFC
jgi:hypothetical protein